jgi:hypothetical protein
MSVLCASDAGREADDEIEQEEEADAEDGPLVPAPDGDGERLRRTGAARFPGTPGARYQVAVYRVVGHG